MSSLARLLDLASAMQVTVLFFGLLKDVTGFSNEKIELEPPASLTAVWDLYSARFPKMSEFRSHVRLALNREFAALDTAVSPDDEIAFLPPVSGGSDGFFGLTREAIDSRALVQMVQRQQDGAVVTFEGVVRDNTQGRPTEFLEYDCYEAMALNMIEGLGRDIKQKHAIDQVAIVHRLGRLSVGEASVVIAVSAPHRKPAFEAALEAINRLKATVPIWKKEHFAGGEVWVDGAWGDAEDAV